MSDSAYIMEYIDNDGNFTGPEYWSGDIDLYCISAVKSLKGLVECGSLDLEGSHVEDLSDLVLVRGLLDLGSKKLKEAPNLRQVQGILLLYGEDIRDLHLLEKVKGGICIKDGPVPYMPKLEGSCIIKFKEEGGSEYKNPTPYGDLLEEVSAVSTMDLIPLRAKRPLLTSIIDAKLRGLT